MTAAQGSEEWFAARLGCVTASRVADVMAKGRGGAPSATRAAYMGELIAEKLTGQPCNAFKGNADTERGNELEPAARELYELNTGNMVRQTGFIQHPSIEGAGASPDGLIATCGGIEIKCPRPHTHLDYLLSGWPPSAYIPQMSMQAACAGLEWIDFVSYCPVMPEDLQLFVVRFIPDPAYIQEMEESIRCFLSEMESKLERIAQRRLNA